MRCGNCCTNQRESNRIYPARQISSTPFCWSAVTTSRSCSSRSLPFDGMTTAFNPRCRAVPIPGASVLLEMTTAIRASGMRPASMLSAIATKFAPRPERRMPRNFIQANIIIHHGDTEARRKTKESKTGKILRGGAVGYRGVFDNQRIKIGFSRWLLASVGERRSTVGDFAFALDNASDRVSFLAHTLQHRLRLLEFR